MRNLRAPALAGLCAVVLAGCNTTGQNELALSRSPDMPVEMAAHSEVAIADVAPEKAVAETADKAANVKVAVAKPVTTGQHGLASWYQLRGRTACGNMNNPAAFTAAHRTLPCGTRILVTNLKNGKSVHVTVTDRGPFVHRRVVDVSRAAAHQIGLVSSGVAPVSVARAN